MALKNITLVSSSWVLFNSEGESRFLDLDKYSILRRLRIHARDLRILDPLLSYPSTILGRERAIIVNLEHIKAIITAEEVWLRDPLDENVIPVVEELQRRLAVRGAFFEGLGEEDEQAADFPFEFRALEVMLEAICSYLDARTTELETDAYPALDELTSKASSLVRDELEQLLDDDEDMGDLYLSRKLSRNSSPISISCAPNWCPASPAVRSKMSRTSRASGISAHEENDVEELEMLLEAYFMQIDSTMNKLTTLREYIDDTEDYINIQLDNHRNQLIQLELCLISGTLSLSVYSLVAAVFGMNIPYSWRDNHEYLFKWVVILAGMASGSVFIWIMTYAGHKGGLTIASKPDVHCSGKITCFVVLSCTVAALGGAIFGYDIRVLGINVVGFCASVLFHIIGYGESVSLLSSVVIRVVQIAADVFSIITVDKVWGGVIMLVPSIVVGNILSPKLGDYGSLSEGYSYVVLILLGIYSASFSFSWGPLGWLVPSEIFQLEIRSAAQDMTVALSFTYTFISYCPSAFVYVVPLKGWDFLLRGVDCADD
uniref:Magnesium transporter n=1 Tax=Chenopodium quinoa TaxID=63459 RepID=A0A803LFH8_CHEQI